MYSLDCYNEEFFSTNQWEGLRHAEWFMPLLVKVFDFKSLIDVGCGTGHFVKWCFDNGLYAVGLEGAHAGILDSLAPHMVMQWDLRIPFVPTARFDLAISIEVAEHIEGEYADTFVGTLCALSDTIVMTAAYPGQGGLQHVNEQPRDYWVDLFFKRGFALDANATADLVGGILAAEGRGEHVATWFRPNIMCLRRDTQFANIVKGVLQQ